MSEQLIKRGNCWYFRYMDGYDVRRMRKGCPDKRETEKMLRAAEIEAALIRSGTVDPKEVAYRNHEARPLAEHLNDWHGDLVAKGKTSEHADLYRDRAGKLIAMVRGVSLADLVSVRKPGAKERAARLLADTLARARFSDLTPEKIQAALASLRDAGRAAQTANHSRNATRAFLRWCYKRGRIRSVPTEGTEGFDIEADLRHIRRSLTDGELARLIAHAQTARTLRGMPGRLRAMAYRAASGTGFRASELRSLNPESFHLDGARPYVTLAARRAKNRKPADQPISQSLARDLREWLRGKPPGESAFPLHRDIGKVIAIDLEDCGIPYETSDGAADFHSLRAYYITALVHSGRSIKEVQQLARHEKVETTLKHYVKVTAHDLYAAVDSLPSLEGSAPAPEAATGTYATNVHTLAPSCIHSGDVSGRVLTCPDVDNRSLMDEESLKNKASDTSGRVLTLADGEGTPGTDSPARGPTGPSPSTRRIDRRARSSSRITATPCGSATSGSARSRTTTSPDFLSTPGEFAMDHRS
jgi:integrase